ncbi:hypothetical protein HanIR_Chr05g0246431 [Helianthus annuus]|nr:hypothetical protein HanIR_Chr05g0246431 [Helianthus annuus]
MKNESYIAKTEHQNAYEGPRVELAQNSRKITRSRAATMKGNAPCVTRGGYFDLS